MRKETKGRESTSITSSVEKESHISAELMSLVTHLQISKTEKQMQVG